MDYELKVKIVRLLQIACSIVFGITAILFLLNFLTLGHFFGIAFTVFGVTFALIAVYLAIVFLVFRGKDQRRFMLESWGWMKKPHLLGMIKKMEVDESFEMAPGEKILFPLTPCVYRGGTSTSFSSNGRDIIVTNKRILIGFYTNIFFIVHKETFGEMNLWRSDIGDIPKVSSSLGGLRDVLSGNNKITKISYDEKNENGEIVGFLKLSYRLYGGGVF